MDFGFTSIPAITVICYLIAEAVKLTTLSKKWLPVICGTVGGILGLIALHIISDYPATNYLSAIAIGIVSGFSATGVNQLVRQFKK